MEPSRSRALRLALSAPVALLLLVTLPAPQAEAATFDLCTLPSVGVIFMGAPFCITPCLGPTYGLQVSGTNACVAVPRVPSVGPCYYGVYVDSTRVCEPLPSVYTCSPPSTVGARVAGVGACQRVPSVGVCSYGVYVDSTGVCTPMPSVSTCNPPATAGATVNGVGTCQRVPVVGVCYYGVYVDGAWYCTDLPSVGLCEYGVVVEGIAFCTGLPSVSVCEPPYNFGAAVNGVGACVDVINPVLGAVNGVLSGTSANAGPLDSDPWARACANHVCAKVTAYPDEAKVCVNAICEEAADLVDLGQDADGDGVTNDAELLANSDPTNPSSRPWTDDDCDGVYNRDEADLPAALGIGHPVLEVTQGEVEADPETLAVEFHPPHFSIHQEGSSSC